MLAKLPVTPAWREDKAFAINNVPYYHDTRVIFQSRSRFWERDRISPNMQFGGETSLGSAWSASEEVKTARGLLAGTASGAGTAERALATYKKYILVGPRTSRRRTSWCGLSTRGHPPASERRMPPDSSHNSGRFSSNRTAGFTSSERTQTT